MRGVVYFSIFFLISCSASRVIHFTNPESNFPNYSTYRLANFKSDTSLSETGKALFNRIQAQINIEMAFRGYKPADTKADMLLRYEVISTNETDYNVRTPYSFRPNYRPYYYDISQRDLTKSMLLIELLDWETKKLIWQGSLDLKYTQKSKKATAWLEESVINIFASYPTKAWKVVNQEGN